MLSSLTCHVKLATSCVPYIQQLWSPPPIAETRTLNSLSVAGIRGQPAPTDWMRNVYRALSSRQGSYDIEVKSSSDGLKVVPSHALIMFNLRTSGNSMLRLSLAC